MPRKSVNPKTIDEELIKNLVDTSPDYTIPGQSGSLPTAVAENDGAQSGAQFQPSAVNIDYRTVFLRENITVDRICCRIDRDVKNKLQTVLTRLGNGRISLYSYIDNILIHHLQTYKDIINDLSKNHSDIL